MALAVAATVLTPPQLSAQGNSPSTTAPRQLYSMRDVIGESVEDVLEELRAIPSIEQVEPAKAITRAQALAAAHDLVRRSSAPAFRAFLDTTQMDPVNLRRLAAWAGMRGGNGALALLLASERGDPAEWGTQYNIAVFLQLEGYPRASLAILDSLRAPIDAYGPGGIDLRATLLLARANALIDLRQLRDAIPLLREARRREPFLVEATRTLARVHLMLNEDEEAKRVLRTGNQRFASKQQMADTGCVKPPVDPTISINKDSLCAAVLNRGRPRLSLSERWPLEKGRTMQFNAMQPPSSLDALPEFITRLSAYVQSANAKYNAAAAQLPTVSLTFGKSSADWPLSALREKLLGDAVSPWLGMDVVMGCGSAYDATPNPIALAHEEQEDADMRFASEHLDDELLATRVRAARRQKASMCADVNSHLFSPQAQDLMNRITGCPQRPADAQRRCVCQVRRAIGSATLARVNMAYAAYIPSVEQWFPVAHHHATAVSSYVEPKDSILKNLLELELTYYKQQATASMHQWMLAAYVNVMSACDPSEESGASQPDMDNSAIGNCGPFDGIGVKLNVVVGEAKFSCYDVEFELSQPIPVLPIINAVGSVNWTFRGAHKGDLTFTFGAGVSSVKAGTYVTFHNGEYADAGFFGSKERLPAGPFSNEAVTKIPFTSTQQVAGGSASHVSGGFVALRSY